MSDPESNILSLSLFLPSSADVPQSKYEDLHSYVEVLIQDGKVKELVKVFMELIDPCIPLLDEENDLPYIPSYPLNIHVGLVLNLHELKNLARIKIPSIPRLLSAVLEALLLGYIAAMVDEADEGYLLSRFKTFLLNDPDIETKLGEDPEFVLSPRIMLEISILSLTKQLIINAGLENVDTTFLEEDYVQELARILILNYGYLAIMGLRAHYKLD